MLKLASQKMSEQAMADTVQEAPILKFRIHKKIYFDINLQSSTVLSCYHYNTSAVTGVRAKPEHIFD